MTVAWDGDVTVTFVTSALASDARVDEAWAWMIEANADPFCNRPTRFATGVFGLKKAVQFAAIVFSSAVVEEEPEDAAAAGDDGDEAGAELVLLPLLHAARLTPMAEARRIQETNLRVFTRTFSSFPHSLATWFLTLTSARRRDQWPAATARMPLGRFGRPGGG